MLPNKLKSTASDEIGNGVFSYMAHHMHCLPVLLTIKSEHFFVQRNTQIRSNFRKNKISKQCMCSHKHEKSPETAFAERVIFLLVEAPPQSPANTRGVLKTQPFRLRLRDFSNRYFSKVFLLEPNRGNLTRTMSEYTFVLVFHCRSVNESSTIPFVLCSSQNYSVSICSALFVWLLITAF